MSGTEPTDLVSLCRNPDSAVGTLERISMQALLHIHLNHEDPEMGKVVLVIGETTAIVAFVFRAIVEMARIALQEMQRRLFEATRPRTRGTGLWCRLPRRPSSRTDCMERRAGARRLLG